MKPPPLSLYVHLPWCVRKCPYCDFNSHTAGNAAPVERYVDALLADLDEEAARAGRRKLETIFLGGGTPSLFPPAEIGRLLDGIAAKFELSPDAEITMEANPGTVECGSPAGYRAAGVTRMSIGAQSFDDEALRRLGRIHSSDDIRRAVGEVREAGFANFNIDLMYGLPGQTAGSACRDVRSAADLEPAHISWYQLTLEPNTVFHARPPADLPHEETVWEIQDAGGELLTSFGYAQYEVSAWARPGRECRHNTNYWAFGDYLAAGAGAHGKISDRTAVMRYRKPANPLQYMQAMEAAEDVAVMEALSAPDLVFEFMLNATRLKDGFAESVFCERTGLDAAVLTEAAQTAIRKGLIERTTQEIWRPTELGWQFLNDLQAEFLRKD